MFTTPGTLLRLWRQRSNGMSQKYLADIIGIHDSYISRIEMDERHPSRQVVLNLARALRLSDLERDQFLASAGHQTIGDPAALLELGLPIRPVYTTVMQALSDQELTEEDRVTLEADITEFVNRHLAAHKAN